MERETTRNVIGRLVAGTSSRLRSQMTGTLLSSLKITVFILSIKILGLCVIIVYG